jgi:hypothetical protein
MDGPAGFQALYEKSPDQAFPIGAFPQRRRLKSRAGTRTPHCPTPITHDLCQLRNWLAGRLYDL